MACENAIFGWCFAAATPQTAALSVGTQMHEETPLLMRDRFSPIWRTAVGALSRGSGWMCCRVKLWGDLEEEAGCLCATDVQVLAMADVAHVCIQFACDCARDALAIEHKRGNIPGDAIWAAIDAVRAGQNEVAIGEARKTLAVARLASDRRRAVVEAQSAVSAARHTLDVIHDTVSSDPYYDHPDTRRTDFPDITEEVAALDSAVVRYAAAMATEQAEHAVIAAVDAARWATCAPDLAAHAAAGAAYLAAEVAGFAACAADPSSPGDATGATGIPEAAARKAYAAQYRECDRHCWIEARSMATDFAIQTARECYNMELEQRLSTLLGVAG